MSSPHPEGVGARLAMQRALGRAGLAPADIDYINLHGTATRVGDTAEDMAVFSLFGEATPCSSTKGYTGHTLGAAGIVEAIISALAIRHGMLPGSPHTETVDPAFRGRYQLATRPARDRQRAEQFVRLWRQQLQPGPGPAAMITVFVEGIGVARPRAWTAGPQAQSGAGRAGALRSRRQLCLPTGHAAAAGRAAARRQRRSGWRSPSAPRRWRTRGADPPMMAMVFASSGGDGETVHEILYSARDRTDARCRRRGSTTRCTTRRPAIGRWPPARARPAPACAPSTPAFAAGLLEAAAQAMRGGSPGHPDRLRRAVSRSRCMPRGRSFRRSALALVLVPGRTERTLAALQLAITDTPAAETPMTEPELERLRLGNPAARALPVLAASARGDGGTIRLGEIDIMVSPS